MKVPFGTLTVSESAKKMIADVLMTERLTMGYLVDQFEQQFARVFGAKEAVAVSSGTDALVLALAALYENKWVRRGDEIIVPALSFVATGNAVLHAGFCPVFVDVELDSMNIDPNMIVSKITPKTRAIVVVHLMGKPAKMKQIMEIAAKHKLQVIEDAAEAHGGSIKNMGNCGTMGQMGCFSTYAAHIVSTVEGGVVVTNDENLAEVLRSLRSHGRACVCRNCVLQRGETNCHKRFDLETGEDTRFSFMRVGYSSKMNELEAAVGLGNLEKFDEIFNKRRRNLLRGIAGVKTLNPTLWTISEDEGELIGPHALPVVLGKDVKKTRAQLSQFLTDHEIDSRTMFECMPTQCPGFAFLGHELGDFPNAEYISSRGVHVGVHQDLNDDQIDHVISTLGEFVRLP